MFANQDIRVALGCIAATMHEDFEAVGLLLGPIDSTSVILCLCAIARTGIVEMAERLGITPERYVEAFAQRAALAEIELP